MARCPVDDHFARSARDVTPAEASTAVRVIFAPVSRDPNVTAFCAGVLSAVELGRANRFSNPADRTRFIQRRAFRRHCGAMAAGTTVCLSQVAFSERPNGRPHLPARNDIWFSFASGESGMLGAWSCTHATGVDMEDRAAALDHVALARCFFDDEETRRIERCPKTQRGILFADLWCLKEAALKLLGEGLPFGMDAFGFDPGTTTVQIVKVPTASCSPDGFAAHLVGVPEGRAAVVLRRCHSSPERARSGRLDSL